MSTVLFKKQIYLKIDSLPSTLTEIKNVGEQVTLLSMLLKGIKFEPEALLNNFDPYVVKIYY